MKQLDTDTVLNTIDKQLEKIKPLEILSSKPLVNRKGFSHSIYLLTDINRLDYYNGGADNLLEIKTLLINQAGD